jgi:hypothetical protein
MLVAAGWMRGHSEVQEKTIGIHPPIDTIQIFVGKVSTRQQTYSIVLSFTARDVVTRTTGNQSIENLHHHQPVQRMAWQT